MADAAAAGGVQQGHAQAAGAGLFQRGEIGGGGDGGIGGCVAVAARRTCQQRQGSEEATAAPLNCRNRRRASMGFSWGPLDYWRLPGATSAKISKPLVEFMPVASTLNFPKFLVERRISHHPAHGCAMLHPTLPLNALRAFEAAARHQNFTRAALELCVSQAALSHQIRGLEDRLGIRLFHRLPRGVALTDEGAALYPVLNESFERISASIARYTGGPAAKY
jgi:hypothetical protein